MNEDIIKWAREAGIDAFGSLDERLIFFAALVRADEREACAKVCEEAAKQFGIQDKCAAAIRERNNHHGL
jgi:uncharacterized membrane protein